jgi:aminotransferase in exopolysaccharide biosynthesis
MNPASGTSELERIGLAEPVLEGNVRAYLEECVATNFVSSVGPFVERFEREFAAVVGARHAVACASGTAAIHVALRLLGVEAHDEVFVSTLTFIASATPIRYERATPVFVDSEERTWNLDPQLVVDEITRRARAGRTLPRAVEIVHVLGQPAEIEPVIEVCERHGIAVLEDAAESLGATYASGRFAGRHVGTIGRVGCYSFNGNKIITTGGGGMITTDDDALARRAKHLTTQARLPGIEYLHDDVGYNYRLTNVAAAMGLAQLEMLPSLLARKRQVAERYDAALRDLPGLSLPPRPAATHPSFWLYSIQLDPGVFDRDEVLGVMRARNIEARPIWVPLHRQPIFTDAPRLGGHVAERLFHRGISLPSSANLTPGAQQRVVDALRVASRACQSAG